MSGMWLELKTNKVGFRSMWAKRKEELAKAKKGAGK